MLTLAENVLTIYYLGDAKVCNSSDSSDGLILCQIEGIHHEASGIDPGVVEGRVEG